MAIKKQFDSINSERANRDNYRLMPTPRVGTPVLGVLLIDYCKSK